MVVVRTEPTPWTPTQILPRYHSQEATVDLGLDWFAAPPTESAPYARLGDPACDAGFQKILDVVRSE
jgi:hypothetical protein